MHENLKALHFSNTHLLAVLEVFLLVFLEKSLIVENRSFGSPKEWIIIHFFKNTKRNAVVKNFFVDLLGTYLLKERIT